MDFDYFYGRDADSFRFIRLPIVLIEDEKFKGLSIDAKVLYSMYLSRSTLSYKNNWIDESGRVYIYFTVEETARQLACGTKKAVKLIKDLEEICLIKKKRAGQGNPTKIYVKDFMSVFRNEQFRPVKKENQDLSKRQFKNSDFDNSRMAKKISQDLSKRQPNYIENNKIDNSYIDFSENHKKGTFLNVIISDEEERKLEDMIPDLNDYIERLSAYMQSTGKTYRDHASTIMTWYLKDKKIYVDNPHGDGIGISQAMIISEVGADLAYESWYVYNDNYGTSEEKAFIKYFQGLVPELKKEYDEIYLVRNERIPALAIYEFDTGERFEPDFLLFLQKYGIEGYLQEQIYIEPKGSHLIEKDKWKEDFLLRIEKEGIPYKKYVDDNEYRIIGLPFFNRDFRLEEFENSVRRKRR